MQKKSVKQKILQTEKKYDACMKLNVVTNTKLKTAAQNAKA